MCVYMTVIDFTSDCQAAMEVLLCVRVCAMGPLCDREDRSSRRRSLCRRRRTSGARRPSGPDCRHAETGATNTADMCLTTLVFHGNTLCCMHDTLVLTSAPLVPHKQSCLLLTKINLYLTHT